MRLKYFFAFVFCFIAFQSTFSQLSTKHYIPPITTSDDIGNQYIYISTPRNGNVSFTITPVGGTLITGIVSNSTPYVHNIADSPGNAPANNSQLNVEPGATNTVIRDKGYIIEAEDVVYVSVRFRQAISGGANQFHAGALVSKGSSSLGTVFRAGGMAYEGVPPSNGGGYLTFLSVMATENTTSVTFSDFPAGISIINHTGATPINAMLNEGETYLLAVAVAFGGAPNDLIGTLINADKPIVVNTGSASNSFGNSADGGGRDYGVDQIVDFSKVGNEYIFVRGNGSTAASNQWENVLIVAHQDNTDVFVNNNPLAETTLNAGEWVVIEGDGIGNNGNGYSSGGNMYVRTSTPVFAYQGVGGTANGEPNQGMFFVPPLSCENRGDVNNIANIDNIGAGVFNGGITIVTNRTATVQVFEDGILRSFDAAEGPFDVDGNPDYVTYKTLTTAGFSLSGNVSVQSTGELYCAYFNQNTAAASGSFYSGFPSPPEINFNTDVATLGNCIPNVTLQSINTDLFDSVEWFFDDGTGGGFVSTGNTTGMITPSLAGSYKLIGTLVCSGATFESQEIPVSLCPDDLDNDLIIDNVDIDLDNDGILNCDESRGNVILDFTDINVPVLNFADASTDATFITPTLNQIGTSTLTGDATSNFTSTVDAATNSELEYILDFNEASNIEFTQNPAVAHTIVNGETFILTIGPNTKNITLLDPDNILLVDSDFDDIFETGVDNFSSSEIRFRLNPTPTGTTPFRLVANNVTQVTFKHLLSNIAESSSFSGNLMLTCFGIDTDNDGIVNAFDADSDNDGIPDLIEVQGTNFTLLGTDADLDGLDDVFGGVGVMPIDSDADGVLDILDLDSDNDGVYDLFEAGHGQADADLDGIIDNAITTAGANGLVDALETVPDNFVLAYTIEDLDTDTIFNYLDPESDGDGCSDVIEAGYADPNNDDFIGPLPVVVDANGKVTGIPDGYTVPNLDYSTGAPILLNTPFEDVAFCEESTSTITLDSTADTFQWEVSNDGGATWSNLVDDATYNGVTTTSLQITNLPLTFDNYQYRVFLQRAGNSCDDTSNAIVLTVEPLPIISAAVELRQCDTDTDGFSDFNLNEAATDISDNFINETFVFYPTLLDAQNDSNPISAADAIVFTNRTVTTDIVWARAISTFGCYRISEVTLIVSTTGIPATFQRNFENCDDFLDINGDDNIDNDDTDGVATFDFSGVDIEIRNLFPPTQALTITYYRNQADALAELNAITDTANYRNIGYPNSQQIYVRVDSDLDNDCLGFGPHITLTVDPVPTATDVSDLELCDNLDDGDGFNGIVQTFDLESQTPLILGTQNPADYTVTYHTNAADANAGVAAITTSGMYTNTVADLQTIYVRVTNNTTLCFTDHTSFDLIVNPLPVANFVQDLEICDDDSDGSAQNGFSQSFDLELQTPGVLGTQDPAIFSVTYHASLADAQAGILPLGSPFSNSVPFSQIIYVRVFNSVTQCANGISNFNAIVNPEPTTENVSNLSYCDDATDGDDTNGFIQNIDLDSQILGILGPLQDEDDFTVTFHETAADASSGNSPLSSPYSNTMAGQQTIYVRVLNDDTLCVNDDFTFDVIVNPLPDFQVTTPQIVCLNGPPLTIRVENPAAVYDYVWTDPNGNMIAGVSEITITSGGLYTITASTTDGTTDENGVPCARVRTIQVDESIIATITDDDVIIVDDNDNNSITIDPTNLGIGDYEYALINEDNGQTTPFQDDPLFENLEGGFYTILVRDKNGCGTASLLVSVVVFPKFFTPNNDGVNDTWAIKGANSTFFPSSQIHIFNRFGKVIAEIDIDNPGWNGTFNGKALPSDDYWFSIVLVPANTNRPTINRKGNFAMLRNKRN